MSSAPSPRRGRRAVPALTGLAVAAAGLALVPAAPVAANPAGTGLVISEVYGGGGNSGATYTHDFIELYNPTDAPISVNGWSVQARSATNTSTATADNVTPLTGSVPAHGHYLIEQDPGAGGTEPLPTPDATGSMGIAGGGWQVWLANTTTPLDPPDGDVTEAPNGAIIDLVGAATNSASFEGDPANEAPSNTRSAQRSADGADTDNNATDFSVAEPTPVNSGAVEMPLEATDPGDVTAYVGIPVDAIELEATGGEPEYTWEVTGLPAGLSEVEDGVIGGTPTTAGTSEVTATVIDDTGATESVTFTIAVEAEPALRPIAEIQGTGPTSPLVGDVVRTQGVVTAAFPTGGYDGFYIQTPGADTTPGAADGIFVYEPGFADTIAVGDSVEVVGRVDEYFGLTQLQAHEITEVADLGDVMPNDTVPGTECELPGSACPSASELAAAREEVESEAFLPTAPYTVTDVYDGSAYNGESFSSRMFGEIGLAGGSNLPLVTPTELIDASDTAALAHRRAYNDAHRVILDDGSTADYTTAANQDSPFPYFTEDHSVRVGAAVTFDEPVVLDYRFSVWRLQPQEQVVGEPEGITFEQTRDENALPADVGGDIKLATFNVLNYFPTTGVEWDAENAGSCDYYVDRDGNIITVDQCGTDADPGPRGAADTENLERQEAKIVDAIVKLDADVVSLEEIENSAKFGKDRDFAVETLVTALNEAEGEGTWAYAPSPEAADLPPLAEQDVIRTAFIYKPATVELVGESRVLVGGPEFEDAREPFGQAFKAVADDGANAFLVIANHFKSKRSGTPDPVQGNGNAERVQQAEALVAFADDFSADLGISRVYLTGDFNAYSEEDPVQVLEAAGYTSLVSTDDPDEETYNFDGAVGSLDHIFANEAAEADVTGVDIWEINANESVYYEYSRYNYNVTNLYGVHPFRSSDHNPEIVGIDVADPVATVTAEDVTTSYQEPATATVAVEGGQIVPTGTVEVHDGGTLLGSGTLDADGVIEIPLDTADYEPGTYELTASYSGDDRYPSASDTFTLTVEKAASDVEADVKPEGKIKPGKKVKVLATVTSPDGFPVSGVVTFTSGGVTEEVELDKHGRADARFSWATAGDHTVTVTYGGNDLLGESTTEVTVHVVKK